MRQTYFNQRANIWDETVAEKDEDKLKQMALRLQIQPSSSVLDVGSGSGVFIPYLLKSIGQEARLVALDFAEEMLKVARRKAFSGNIEYIVADVSDIPIPKETFSAVVCYSSFPHFQDKPEALKEMRRVLKPGGRLFICHTSGRSEINGIHKSIPEVQNDLLPDAGEMKALLEEAGFSGITIEDRAESYLASAQKPAVHPEVPPQLPATEVAFTPASQTAVVLGSRK